MEEDPIDQVTSARRERLMALRAAKEYASIPDADGDGNKNIRMEESTTNDYEQNTTMEEDPVDQVTSARRERLMALRAAKEYASVPDADGVGNKNNRMEEESTTNDYEQNTTMEEDPIDQVTSARRERLMALRAAKEYASMPDADGDGNKNNRMQEESTTNDYEQKVPETIEEGSTEQASATRKERLMALKTAKELLSTTDDITKNNGRLVDTEENGENIAPNMKFRNYLPHDKHLQEGKLAPVELPKFEDPVAPAAPQPSEKIEDPFVNIAPKKPNWDLRRDVQKRLDKLERRTQKALYELMLEQEKEKGVTEHANGGYAD